MALRWKNNPHPTGLAGVCARPQGSTLRENGTRYATTSYSRSLDREKPSGWYWVAGWGTGIPHFNSCNTLVADEATAKAEAMAYVKKHFAASQQKEPSNAA